MTEFTTETQTLEYKSIRKIRDGKTALSELARTCVCLANANGGILFVGIEDKVKEPPHNQKITFIQRREIRQRRAV